MLPPGLAMHAPDISPLKPTPCRLFFHLPIRQALGPAEARTARPTGEAGGRTQRATSTGCQEGRLLAVRGSGAARREMPRMQPLLGSVHPGSGLLVGPSANDERHDPLAIRGDRRMVPHVPGRGALRCGPPLLLVCTQLQGSSHATARGVTWRTRRSCTRSAWRPAIRRRRATVAVATVLKRAVARTPHPAPR